MNEPRTVVAGDTVSWTRAAGDYPSDDGWSLTYYFGAPKHTLDPVVAMADGEGGWTIDIPATVTSQWAPDDYTWQAVAVKAAERRTVASARMSVLPSLENAERFDDRSEAEKRLELLDQALHDKAAGGDRASYSIGGRSLTLWPWAELQQARDRAASEVAREQRLALAQRGKRHDGVVRVWL